MDAKSWARFSTKFVIDQDTNCWVWIGRINASGKRPDQSYGHFDLNGKPKRAHRASWEHFNGAIAKGLCVCHSCDNPKCVNPQHLWLGTISDNMQDSVRKGRFNRARGTRNGSAKLTINEIMIIRARRNAGETFADIAKDFAVCRTSIRNVVSTKTWKHVQHGEFRSST